MKTIMNRKIEHDCPFCDKVHEISVITKESQCLINNEPVNYIETVCYCPVEDDEFCSEEMLNENLLNARQEYKKRHNI